MLPLAMGTETIGIALVALGLFFLVRTLLFLRGAVSTQGKVVGLENRGGSRGPTYSPVVEYAAADGVLRRFTEAHSSNRPGVEVGDPIPVKYDPNRPERARIDKPFRLWFLPGLLLSMGIPFALTDLV